MPDAAQQSAAPAGASCCELADVFVRYGQSYQARHRLTPQKRKAIRDITRCRTAALDGHREWCEGCGFERFVYHSCRNRHCPKCQTMATAARVEARQQELLPVPYFHNIFTLPHERNPLILYSERNQRALLKLLFDAAAQTLLASGALADDKSRWIAGGRKFLFAVHGLSKMFRAKYLDGLADLLEDGRLHIPPQLAELAAADSRRRLDANAVGPRHQPLPLLRRCARPRAASTDARLSRGVRPAPNPPLRSMGYLVKPRLLSILTLSARRLIARGPLRSHRHSAPAATLSHVVALLRGVTRSGDGPRRATITSIRLSPTHRPAAPAIPNRLAD